MALYKLNAPHFLGDRYYEAGAVVDFDGPPSRQMDPVDDAARARAAQPAPEPRRSPDLPVSLRHDPNRRWPGQPRVAGPPGQEAGRSADPANPVRTVEIVEQTRANEEQQRQDRVAQAATDAAAAEERNRPARRRRARATNKRPKGAAARRQAITEAKTAQTDASNPEAE